jgi:hypothetical protein
MHASRAPSVCRYGSFPRSGTCSHWSRRMRTDGSVAVNACAIRAAYFAGWFATPEKSPSVRRIAYASIVGTSRGGWCSGYVFANGVMNQTECSRSAEDEYARNSNLRTRRSAVARGGAGATETRLAAAELEPVLEDVADTGV